MVEDNLLVITSVTSFVNTVTTSLELDIAEDSSAHSQVAVESPNFPEMNTENIRKVTSQTTQTPAYSLDTSISPDVDSENYDIKNVIINVDNISVSEAENEEEGEKLLYCLLLIPCGILKMIILFYCKKRVLPRFCNRNVRNAENDNLELV